MSDMSSQPTSAYAIIANTLANYGLQDLAETVRQIVFEENITDEAVVYGRIRETPQYRQRFRANEERRARGLNALSEAEYINMENMYRWTLRSAGMPANFYDTPEELSALIAGDVSPNEFSNRIVQGYQAVKMADQNVVQEMKRLYGVDDSQLAAYFLDPDKGTQTLLQQARSAEIAAQARTQAGMEISVQTAQQLAQAGVSQQQAQQGFGQIGAMQELFQPLQGEEAITQAEQVAGVFGVEGAAQQRIRQRIRGRQAAFETGGQFVGQQSTVTGLQ